MVIISTTLLIEGISSIACLYLITLFLHIVLPGRSVEGYACADDNGSSDGTTAAKPQRAAPEVLEYKLNGALVTIVSIPLAAYLCAVVLPPYSGNNEDYDENEIIVYSIIKGAAKYYKLTEGCVVGGNLCGILISMAFYLRGSKWIATAQKNGLDTEKMENSKRCITKDQLGEYNESVKIDAVNENGKAGEYPNDDGVTAFLEKFYLGKGEFNPRTKILGCDVDWKMWLYLAGTVALEMHVLSMVAAHALMQNIEEGGISRAMIASAAMWTWFCFDYLTHEHVHLYTYDLFAERLGLKLIWGCCGVYPFLYPLALRCLVRRIDEADDLSIQSTVAILILFVFGWILTRGANDQKFAFKIDPKKKAFIFCGLKVKQLSIEVGNRGNEGTGKSRGPRKILVGGWWGLARHVNYMGEIVQGLAMSLPAFIVTKSPISFVYFAFITALLVPRQKEDDIICRQKYGKVGWDEYTRLVPSKIVPLVY